MSPILAIVQAGFAGLAFYMWTTDTSDWVWFTIFVVNAVAFVFTALDENR